MSPVHLGRHRILAFVLHRGVSGHAAVDGFGVVEGSVSTLRLGRRIDRDPLALARTVERCVRRFAPSLVVFSFERSARPVSCDLLAEAEALLRARGVPTVRRSASAARRLLLGDQPNAKHFALATLVVEAFAPELDVRLPRTSKDREHTRPMWGAVALAVQELVHQAPRAAVALLRPNSRISARFLLRASQCDHRLHPPYDPP